MNRVLVPLLIILAIPLCGQSQELPTAGGDPTVIGQVEHIGYGLVGSRGRFYVFGGIAMADYSDSAGTRRIVTLQLEDQIQDEKHVYYRELRELHRWAFSRTEGTDGMYGVWIQLAASDRGVTPKWQSFQRARLETPRDGGPVPQNASAGQLNYGTCCQSARF